MIVSWVPAMDATWHLQLPNVHQQVILNRLLHPPNPTERDQLYFVGEAALVEPSGTAGGRRPAPYRAYTVLGSLRVKQGVPQREHYTIHMYQPNTFARGTFWCSCPDHKFHSAKRGTLCKHISFLVTKVARWPVAQLQELFSSQTLGAEALTALVDALGRVQGHQPVAATGATEPAAGLLSVALQSAPIWESTSSALFQDTVRPLEPTDPCPICFDDLTDASQRRACPACHQYVHRECVEVWLERHRTCVMCRSDVWKLYRPL